VSHKNSTVEVIEETRQDQTSRKYLNVASPYLQNLKMRLNLRQVSKNLKNHHKSIQLRDQSIKKLINTNETPSQSSKYRHLSYTAETETDKTRISPTYAGLLHQGMSP
jgi:hypothetical protein